MEPQMYQSSTPERPLHPAVVHCPICRFWRRVDPAECVEIGWPTCCGRTMVLEGQGEHDVVAASGGR